MCRGSVVTGTGPGGGPLSLYTRTEAGDVPRVFMIRVGGQRADGQLLRLR